MQKCNGIPAFLRLFQLPQIGTCRIRHVHHFDVTIHICAPKLIIYLEPYAQCVWGFQHLWHWSIFIEMKTSILFFSFRVQTSSKTYNLMYRIAFLFKVRTPFNCQTCKKAILSYYIYKLSHTLVTSEAQIILVLMMNRDSINSTVFKWFYHASLTWCWIGWEPVHWSTMMWISVVHDVHCACTSNKRPTKENSAEWLHRAWLVEITTCMF